MEQPYIRAAYEMLNQWVCGYVELDREGWADWTEQHREYLLHELGAVVLDEYWTDCQVFPVLGLWETCKFAEYIRD